MSESTRIATVAVVPITGQILGAGESVVNTGGIIVSIALSSLSYLQKLYHKNWSKNMEKVFDATFELNGNLNNLSHRIYAFVLAIATVLWVGGLYRYIKAHKEAKIEEILQEVRQVQVPNNDVYKKLAVASEMGSPEAHYLLAAYFINYFDYAGIEKSEEKFLKHLMFAADHSYPEAQFQLGKRFLSDASKPENKKIGIDLIKKAAYQGHVKAQVFIAYKFDSKMALYWLNRAAANNDPFGRLSLALHQYQKVNGEANPNAGIDVLAEQANNGYSLAMYELGKIYLARKNKPAGIRWMGEVALKDDRFIVEFNFVAEARKVLQALVIVNDEHARAAALALKAVVTNPPYPGADDAAFKLLEDCNSPIASCILNELDREGNRLGIARGYHPVLW